MTMPEEVRKIVEKRLKETAKDKEQAFDQSDMYLDDFKRNFGSVMMDSRNAASRSNKPIASQLARGGPNSSQNSRNSRKHDDDMTAVVLRAPRRG